MLYLFSYVTLMRWNKIFGLLLKFAWQSFNCGHTGGFVITNASCAAKLTLIQSSRGDFQIFFYGNKHKIMHKTSIKFPFDGIAQP